MKSVLSVLRRIMDVTDQEVTDQEVTDAIQTWNKTNKSNFYELSNWEKGCTLHEIIKIIKNKRS